MWNAVLSGIIEVMLHAVKQVTNRWNLTAFILIKIAPHLFYTLFSWQTQKKHLKTVKTKKNQKKIERKILKKSKYEPEVVVHEEQDLK